MSNRFKDITLRKEYDAVMAMYETKHRNLFCRAVNVVDPPILAAALQRSFGAALTDRRSGCSIFENRSNRNTLAYAYYRAGQDVAKAAAK